MPMRIQRKRIKGWRKPATARIVDRTSTFGNPFKIGEEGPLGRQPIDNKGAVGFFVEMLADPELRIAAGYPSDHTITIELKGEDLACWCSLDQPCHADILLEIANR